MNLSQIRKIHPRDYLTRFIFGAVVSIVAGVIVKVAGPVFGGLFLAFPAILPATLTLLERKDGTAQAASDIRGASIGALALIAFAAVMTVTLTRGVAPWLALIAALGAWTVAGLLIWGVLRLLLRAIGEHQYLPEVSTAEMLPLVDALRARNFTVACAESCTGGLVASLFAALPDASETFAGGLVPYQDQAKVELVGVRTETLQGQGAVSRETARELARGARHTLHADVGIGVTGLLGTSAEGKPPGLTYVAVALPDETVEVREFEREHGPGRDRERAVRMAIALAQEAVEGHFPRAEHAP